MSKFELQRETQAFRLGYWDAFAGRGIHHIPPYEFPSARIEYHRGHQAGLIDYRSSR